MQYEDKAENALLAVIRMTQVMSKECMTALKLEAWRGGQGGGTKRKDEE